MQDPASLRPPVVPPPSATPWTADSLAQQYGFTRIELSSSELSADKRAEELDALASMLESMAQILRPACGVSIEEARQLCGLRGRIALCNIAPEAMANKGAAGSYNPSTAELTVATGHPDSLRNTAFAHEWAHALDDALSLEHAPEPKHPAPPAEEATEILKRFLVVSDSIGSSSPAPHQEMIGAVAAFEYDRARYNRTYASVAIHDPRADTAELEARLPAFSNLVRNLIPQYARAMTAAQRRRRFEEGRSQIKAISDFAFAATRECLEESPEFRRLQSTPQELDNIAKFCSEAIVWHCKNEGSRRQGRDEAMDGAKKDIAEYLRDGHGMDAHDAQRAAFAIFHITSIKQRLNSPEFSLPYTGFSYWCAPASMLDLCGALVRVFRNQNALENLQLEKEKFHPLSFWWSQRRNVSEKAAQFSARTLKTLSFLHPTKIHPETASKKIDGPSASELSKQWRASKGEYAAGAAAFSDLTRTGLDMLVKEAALTGRKLARKAARSLRKKITAPLEKLAYEITVKEALAESIELFILSNASLKTPLGRACKNGLARGLVDPDDDNALSALHPNISWLDNKDGDIAGNQTRWRALFRELPAALPYRSPPAPRTPAP